MKKKIISLCLLVLYLLPNASFANQTNSSVGVTENPSYLIDESINNELSYKPYGFEVPIFPFFVNLKPYHFSGQTSQNPLYSKYTFVGKTTYHVEASSLSDDKFYVTAYKKVGYRNEELTSQKSSSKGFIDFYVDTEKTSDQIFLKFSAPSHFYGQIS